MVKDAADVGDPRYKFALDPIAEYLAADRKSGGEGKRGEFGGGRILKKKKKITDTSVERRPSSRTSHYTTDPQTKLTELVARPRRWRLWISRYPRFFFSCFFFSSRRRHTRLQGDWSSDVCSSDLAEALLLDSVSVTTELPPD